MKLPSRWVRRLCLWPIPIISAILYVATVPLLITLALLLSYRLPGKFRMLRALGLFAVYLFIEANVLVSAFVLWIASGFGWKLRSQRFVAAHYWILKQVLALLVGAVKRLFSLSIEADGPALPASIEGLTSTGRAAPDTGPLVVLSRHAGPADSLLLLHQVMSWQGRRPRIVAKDLLQLDPALDVLLNRLPNRFISPNPGKNSGTVDAIAQLAEGMTANDAFVIFPEGGNFTEKRRVKAIDRLRKGGHLRAAERASELRNVLPPRPSGTKAVLRACPEADIVFVAHTGLDQIATVADLWTAIPQQKVVEMSWQVVPSSDIPKEEAEQEEMLFLAWESIDSWIQERRQAETESQLGNCTPGEPHREDV